MATYINGKKINLEKKSKATINKRVQVTGLIETAVRENHYCNKIIKDASFKLVDKISGTRVAVGRNNNSGNIYGATSLTRIFSESFDSAILQVFPIGSFIHSALSTYLKHEYPLSQYLSDKNSYIELKETIRLASLEYRDTCSQDNSREVFETNFASLELLMVVLNDIAEIAPLSIKPKWCSVCFRRYPCREHRTNLGDKNLVYEEGRAVIRSLTKDVLHRWKTHRCERTSAGENFTLISAVDDVTENYNGKGLAIDKNIHELIKMTKNQLWTIASQYWEVFIKENFQQISSKLPLPSNFIDFNTYEGEVLSVLNNKSEKSNHPLWFLNMLDEANDWCIAEQKNSIKTIDKILEYYPNITTNQSEIARKIGCTKSAVSKALNIYKAKVY